jgi:hypothetical protein
MAILKQHERYWEKVAIYGDYKPWNAHKEGGGSTSYPAHSGRILDLKEDKAGAVDHFAKIIEPELSDDIVVVPMPSHDPASVQGGLHKLAARLAQKGNRVDGSGCLIRSKKIEKLAHGGDRTKEVQLGCMAVKKAHLIKGKDVLLLDEL